MQRTWALISLLVIIAGLALGYFLAPHYQPPNEAGQGRLRQRAEALYRALRQMDYSVAVRMMTPARQYLETAKLRDAAKATEQSRDGLASGMRASLRQAADSISADKLDIRIEGNWALTSGSSEVYENGEPLPFPLEELVWVCTAGDWWNYAMTPAEMAAYGNPPDFAREALLKKKHQPATREIPAPLSGVPGNAAPSTKPDIAGKGASSAKPAPEGGAANQEAGHGA